MEEDKNVTNVMMKKEKESISTFKNTNTNIRNINNNNDNKNNVILKCFNIGNNNNNIIPLSNNDYQEYAFLQVQSVHNYSKASRLGTGPGARCNEKSSINSISGCRQYKNNNENDDDNDNEDCDDECNFNVNENQKILKKEMKKYVVNNDYDDDDDDDDDTMSRKNAIDVPDCGESNNDGEEKLTPDHHTRRPMNAFLIFCKRHRAIVRDKYKNLENRSITKILGDWWATLNTEEKACYTGLAKQYKDAFFSANPNFKWYKLPAPPLRTLNTRPGNVGRSTITATTTTTDLFNHSDTDEKNSISNENLEINSPTPTDRSSTATIIHDKSYEEENYTEECPSFEDEQHGHQQNYSNVGIFKLADETQMGELNSLIKNERQQQQQQSNDKMNSSVKRLLTVNNSNNTEEENLMNNSPSKNKSANVYAPLSTNDSLLKEPIKDCIITNKEVENKNYPGKRKAFINDDAAANEDDETQNFSSKRKSVRTCKGKKYQEFRCSGQIMPSFVKKQQPKLKPKSSSSSSLSSSWSFKYDDDNDDRAAEAADNNCDCNYYSSFSSLKAAGITAKKMQIEFKLNDETNNSIENNQFNSSNNIKQSTIKQQQQFYNFDFDLEEKIKSLPIQNLDNYLQRKRDTKKKKKFNSKKQNLKCFENTATKTTTTSATNNNNSISVSNNNNTVIDYNNVSNNKKVSLLNDQEENRNNQFQQMSKTTAVVVGSQKRKARKESITRRDINPNVMNVIGSQAQQDQHQKSPSQSSLLKLNIMQSIFDTNSEILPKSKSKSISQIQQQSESDDNIIKLNHNNTMTTDSMPMDSYTNLHSLNILAEVAANHIGDEKT